MPTSDSPPADVAPASAEIPVAVAPDPADAHSAVTDPAVTDPAVTDPAVTDPAVTDPAVTDPVGTDLAGADPAGVWRLRGIVLLLSAQFVSILGTQITDLALPSLAVLRLGAGPAFTSALITAAMLPGALAGPLLGVVVDRVPARAVMVTADVVRALVLAGVPVAAATGHLSLLLLLVVAALAGLASSPFDAATVTMLPRLAGGDRLVRANSWVAGCSAIGRILGPGLAGGLIGLVGAASAIVADVGSYVASASLLAFLRPARLFDSRGFPAPSKARLSNTSEPASGTGDGAVPARSWRGDLVRGVAVVRSDSILTRALLGVTLLNLGGAGIGGVIAAYAYRHLGLTPGQLGLTMAVGSVGVLGGAFAAPRIGRACGVGNAVFALSVIAAAILFLIPVASLGNGFVLLTIYEIVFGFAAAAWGVLLNTLIQVRTPAEVLGRVAALSQSLGTAALPIGTGTAAMASSTLGVVPAILILCVAACGAPVLYASRRFRDYRREPVTPGGSAR